MRGSKLTASPLLRLLAINLAGGIAAAVLLLSGLMALNPFRLRDLILADQSGGAALGLLLFGFVVTFGSVAMGTAIMALRHETPRDRGKRGKLVPVRVRISHVRRGAGRAD